MARHYAISIGINYYRYYAERPLRCAENDATEMQAFLSEVGFQDVFLYSDRSPAIDTQSTQPERTNLLRALGRISSRRFLKPEDSFWFFFSGHGARRAGFDYLLPSDGDPENLVDTAIPIDRVIRSLRECGAGNLVLILDACRNQVPELSKDMGSQTKELAKQEGVITLFSCSPGERSYELPDRQQGAFTFALLEALRGECHPGSANAKQLNDYLQNRVPALAQALGKQTPYLVAEPYEKGIQILLPLSTSPPSVESPPTPNLVRLEADIYRAILDKNLTQAEQLCRQFNQFAVTPEDRDRAWELIQEVKKPHHQTIPPPVSKPDGTPIITPPDVPSPPPSAPKFVPPSAPTVPTLEFEVVKIDRIEKGLLGIGTPRVITSHRTRKAEYHIENLGNGVQLEMVSIPGDTFTMGSPDSEEGRDWYGNFAESLKNVNVEGQHQVTVNPFWMGKYPITQAQWRAVAALSKVERDLESDPSSFKGNRRPVEQVNWDDATEFCARLSKKTGQEYRLPSEAEWEYTCRAGTTTPFYFGETVTPDLVNYDGNCTYGNSPKGVYRQKTTDVGSFPPNAFGLYDTHGNVWEWCQDTWHDNYVGAPTDGSAWVGVGGVGETSLQENRPLKLLRGGSWLNNPRTCRSAYRHWGSAGHWFDFVGFRVACSVASTLQSQN